MKKTTTLFLLTTLLLGCSGNGTPEDGNDMQDDLIQPDDGAGDVAAAEDVQADDGVVDDTVAGDVMEEDAAPEDEAPHPPSQIIADHTVVDRCDDIPAAYLNQVKTMWINILGESHSSGYRKGVQLLADSDPRFPAVVTEDGPPEPYRTDALRISNMRRSPYSSWQEGAGEALWYTNEDGKTQIKNHITYCETNDLHISAVGFGWCWDMTWHNSPDGGVDPVYNVRWAGSSEGGPDGDLRWGLDDGDLDLTGNHVSMDTYLAATQEYIAYCSDNGYATAVLFTTGPVDGYSGESGYQRHVKHEHIRRYVLADPGRILFDYADILAWSDAGDQNLQSWTDGGGTAHEYQMIHSDNMLDLDGTYTEDGDHIGQRGALRLGKAVWWVLARIAGWDGY